MLSLHAKLYQLRHLLSGVWLKKRQVTYIAVTLCVIGCVLVAMMPNKYESTAKVYADTKSLLKPLLQGMAVHGDSDEEVRVMAQNLLSRPMLESIARQSGLHLKYATPESYEVFLVNFQQQIQLTGSRKQNLFSISYQHNDPKMAKKVVELTLQNFVDATVGQSRQENDSATDFLNGQIYEQKQKLELAEKSLAEFKQKYQNVLPQRGGSYFQEVSQLQQQIEELELLIKEKSATLSSLQQSVRGGASSEENNASPIQSIRTPIDDRIVQIEDSLLNLEVRYTKKHPDIQELTALLIGLKAQQKEMQQEILNSIADGQFATSGNGEQNVLHETSLSLMTLRSEIDAMLVRKKSLSERLADRMVRLDEIPEIEAKLTGLTRDYNTTRELYQNLLQRRDSAVLSKSMNENTSEIKFRVIDPPTEPLLAIGPPRAMMYVIVLFLSVGAGVGVAFISSQISSVVRGGRHLSLIVGQGAVLASMPDLNDSPKVRRLHAVLFILIMLGLMAFVGLLVAHEILTSHSPLFWLRG